MLCRQTSGGWEMGNSVETNVREWEMWNVVQTNVRGMENVESCTEQHQGNVECCADKRQGGRKCADSVQTNVKGIGNV